MNEQGDTEGNVPDEADGEPLSEEDARGEVLLSLQRERRQR